jgi:hypothetical protein
MANQEPLSEASNQNVYLTATIKGVVLPTWFAVALGLAALLSALTLVLTLVLGERVLTQINEQLTLQRQETRLLQLHVQDIESKFIESGIAHRQDFAPWDSPVSQKKGH